MTKVIVTTFLLAVSATTSAQMTEENLKEKTEMVAVSLKRYAMKKDVTTPLKYQHAFYDLNNDNRLDAVALLTGPDWCNTDGCTMAIMKGDFNGFDFLGTTTSVNTPIGVDPTSQRHGYVSFILNTKKNDVVKMRFESSTYPKTPDNAPKASEIEQARQVILIK
jgi:hypothetical protein